MKTYKIGDKLYKSIVTYEGELPNITPKFFVEELKCSQVRETELGFSYCFGGKYIHHRTTELQKKYGDAYGLGLFETEEEALKDAELRSKSIVYDVLLDGIEKMQDELNELNEITIAAKHIETKILEWQKVIDKIKK